MRAPSSLITVNWHHRFFGADRDGLLGDAGQRIRRAEDVDDVDGHGHVGEALEALLAEDLGLARVDGDDAVAVPLEVEADEVAGAQLVLRQPDDRDGLRVWSTRWMVSGS